MNMILYWRKKVLSNLWYTAVSCCLQADESILLGNTSFLKYSRTYLDGSPSLSKDVPIVIHESKINVRSIVVENNKVSSPCKGSCPGLVDPIEFYAEINLSLIVNYGISYFKRTIVCESVVATKVHISRDDANHFLV
ncbi:hypothetical protein RCL_jg13503.t2 [Rhizophagus clarus]|uniref:Uncharacterized protein n=1 Tax=Rhizophagus clarus TaxID=94130 RepID=A0A8H3LS99_9GLOM|nr:hypothetical protein RCL_jg13503.t2 [Rhizophagus clarus]